MAACQSWAIFYGTPGIPSMKGWKNNSFKVDDEQDAFCEHGQSDVHLMQ